MVHAFPQFELDEERFELRRDGRPVRAEPRVLEVLAYLIRNGGRVVTKDELLETVWKKSFVSDSALTRCIMEARRAIGDQERSEPLIRTVHGRGYRFEAEALPPHVAEPAPLLALTPVPEPESVSVAELPLPQSGKRSLIVRRAATAIVLAASIAACGWLWVRGTAQAAPRAAESVRLALLPISIDREDRELQMVGMSIADLLEQRLAKTGRVRVRGADYSRPISVSAPNLVELASRASADYVISGSMTADANGNGARLTLLMHEIRKDGAVRDTPLGSFQLPLLQRSQDIAQYVRFRDRVVSRVVETLLPAFDPQPAGPFTPRTSESYRLYLLARERLAAGGCDGEAAIELLRRSLEIDDRFAPAWDAHSWALYRLSSACTEGAKHHANLLRSADRALMLAPSLGSVLTLKARVLMETGQIEKAQQFLRDALERDPANIDLHRAEFMLLAQAGFLDGARSHLRRVASSEPNALFDHAPVAMPYVSHGGLQQFLASSGESDTPAARYTRGFAELILGNPDTAYRTLEPSFRSNPADAYARLSHALLAIIEGRHLEARAIVRHFARQRELVGERDAELTYRLAQVASLAGDDALATRQLASAVNDGFYCVEVIDRDPALNAIRGTGGYERARAIAIRKRDAFGLQFGLRR